MRYLRLFERFSSEKEIIIVGGGIASLYAAYKLKKRFPNTKFQILEMSSECGGRVKMYTMENALLPTGAQFSRLEKDKYLYKLLKELKIKTVDKELEIDYTFHAVDINPFINKIKKSLPKLNRSNSTFKKFAKNILGEQNYNLLTKMMGYTDYENADVKDTISNYGLDDNLPGYKITNLNWNELVEKLIDFIGKENIKLNTKVTSIKKTKDGFILNDKMECDGVIIGVTINQLRKLLSDKIYNQIESQNFIKVFGKVKGLETCKNYTVVDSELKKVIPIKNDIFTIAFSDNEDASKIESKGKKYFEEMLSKHFDSDVKVSKIKRFIWEEGTHFYKPLKDEYKSREEFIKKAQHPQENLWVIGEVVALKQGWVEGALSSVENLELFK